MNNHQEIASGFLPRREQEHVIVYNREGWKTANSDMGRVFQCTLEPSHISLKVAVIVEVLSLVVAAV